MTGFYGLATLVLTGEARRSHAEFIEPRRPIRFGAAWGGTGAFELVVRASGLYVGKEAFAPTLGLVEANAVSSGATSAMIGLNWYWNRWVWVQSTFEHTVFSQALPLGANGRRLGWQEVAGGRATVMW